MPRVPRFLTLTPSVLVIFLYGGNCCILSSDLTVVSLRWLDQSSGLEENVGVFFFLLLKLIFNLMLCFSSLQCVWSLRY